MHFISSQKRYTEGMDPKDGRVDNKLPSSHTFLDLDSMVDSNISSPDSAFTTDSQSMEQSSAKP